MKYEDILILQDAFCKEHKQDAQRAQKGGDAKGQLISKCLFEVFVWTKIPTKNLIISALKGPGQKLSKFSLVFLVQMMIS